MTRINGLCCPTVCLLSQKRKLVSLELHFAGDLFLSLKKGKMVCLFFFFFWHKESDGIS